jgi:hypothetical protein
MNIQDYIFQNWPHLPKSSFNETEVVIFSCLKDDDWGYGHHSYSGYGVVESGEIVWCFSSGCSCGGGAGYEKKDIKVLFSTGDIDPEQYEFETIDFKSLEVHFSDY